MVIDASNFKYQWPIVADNEHTITCDYSIRAHITEHVLEEGSKTGEESMRFGYIVCGLAHDAAHVVLAAKDPPPSIPSTDWSQFPAMPQPNLLIEGTGTYFLLRIPGDAKGLWTALEEI